MSIATRLIDGGGTSIEAKVTNDRALLVTNLPYPPVGVQLIYPVSQYLTLDGTPDGTNSMKIDGSVTVQNFFIEADDENDIYISELGYILGYGGAASLYRFADSGAPLTNGIRIFFSSFTGEHEIGTILKTNADMLRLCVSDFLPSDWESRNFNAVNDYGYIGRIDMASKVPQYGIKLDKGSNQKLVVSIRDDLTGFADLFNFLVSGIKRFEL